MVFEKDTDGTLNTGLVGWWSLNGTTDSLGLRELRQWGSRLYNGLNVNPVTFHRGVAGYATFVKTSATVNQALLNDINSPLPVSNNPVSVKTNDFSWCGWVRIPITETVSDFFHNGNVSATNVNNVTGWRVGMGGSVAKKFYGAFNQASSGTPASFSYSGTDINTGDWIFLGFSVSSTKVFKVYINASLVATVDCSVGFNDMRAPNTGGTNGGTEFGLTSTFGTYSDQKPFTGDMRWVGVWDKVLVQQEFTDLYNSGSGQRPITSTLVSSQYPSGIKKAYIKTGSEKWQNLGQIRNGELKVTPEKSNNTFQNNLALGAYLFEAKFEMLQTALLELEKIDSLIDGTNSFLFQLTDAVAIPSVSSLCQGWSSVSSSQIGVKPKYISENDPQSNQFVEILIKGSILSVDLDSILKSSIVDTDFHLSSTASESFSDNNSLAGGTVFGYYKDTTAGNDTGILGNIKPNGFATVEYKYSPELTYTQLGRVDNGKISFDWIAQEDSLNRFIVFNMTVDIEYDLLVTDPDNLLAIDALNENDVDMKITLFDGKVFTFESKLGIDSTFDNTGDFTTFKKIKFAHKGNILTTDFDSIIS